MDLGTKLKLLRVERKLSQADLAQKIDAEQTQISNYERNDSIPTVPVLKKLARIFNVTTDYLIFDNNDDKIIARIKDKELLELIDEYDKLANEDKTILRGLIKIIITKNNIQRAAIQI